MEKIMSHHVTTELVWNELGSQIFAVLGMVSARGEARTAGIVYIIHNNKLYISTGKDSWKARHTRGNPHVSLTVPIAKRVPLLPWIKIPAATITFSGKATVHDPEDVEPGFLATLLRGMEKDADRLAEICVIEVEPVGDFITYGVGVTLMQMRDPALARGRTAVR
jgi:hypothetical protein